ncbi:GIY-YIG nuclease family protein [Bradyrhizobium sp. ORS 86]|uniref:GIY-YIG nuclease family protein n=1 Tax=Bradyrhizobium sp. ORS 86 TaxID=1685970 RepID=UPI00388E38CD
MAQATFVYVISGDHGRQKIGVSDDPRKRIRELQTGSPFLLHFVFIGVTEGTAYDIEGEAHFLLDRHKAPGGDEWFVVPPEVAIAAVMACAHRLGHRLKPIDAEDIGRHVAGPANRRAEVLLPRWVNVAVIGVAGLCALAVLAGAQLGRFDLVQVLFLFAVIGFGAKSAIFLLGEMTRGLIEIRDSVIGVFEPRAPSSPDRT